MAGDADLNSADLLRESIARARAGPGPVVIDLTATTLLDSRTIGVLATAVEKLRGEGRTMPIVCADDNILRLFATIGLEAEFRFFPTLEAARRG